MHLVGFRAAPQFFKMAIEALEFGKEADVETEPIEQADGIVRIDGGDDAIAGIVNGLEVAGRHEAGDPGDGKILDAHRCPRATAAAGSTDCAAEANTAASCGAVTRSE